MKNLKVVSVGYGGMNALNHMIDSGLTGAEFIAFSVCDEQALQMSKATKKILLGKRLYGLDGSTVERSERTAVENREKILSALRGADAVIIVAGLGGFNGTGATPIVAEYAREVNALTVAVVTCPFTFEGPKRTARAEAALEKLSAHADSVIKIRNDNFLPLFSPRTPMTAVFKCADEIICRAVRTLLAAFQKPFRVDAAAEI